MQSMVKVVTRGYAQDWRPPAATSLSRHGGGWNLNFVKFLRKKK
jgi:hypothetical protein